MKYQQRLAVRFEYDVVFTRSVFALDNDALATVLGNGCSRAVFFVDEGLVSHWPELPNSITEWCREHSKTIELATTVEIVPGGEKIKNNLDILDIVGRLSAQLGLDRQSYAVIVGGGAVLDAVGFAVATVHRGLRQIRVPTTALSQGDSGVGVKNSLNRFGIKNYYGAFAPPWAVMIDTDFLKTLEQRDWVSGIAEAFKVGIIKDKEFMDYLGKNAKKLASRDQEAMEHVIQRSAHLHLDHIRLSGDAFERESSRPLDFGHWAAHRLEDMTGYELRHGEAVAIGMALDIHCAMGLGLIDKAGLECVLGAMERSGLALWHEALARRAKDGDLEVLSGLDQFRQHLGGELTLAMPRGLGDMVFINELSPTLVEDAIEFLKERAEKCSGETRT